MNNLYKVIRKEGINTNTRLYKHIERHMLVMDFNTVFIRIANFYETTLEYKEWTRKRPDFLTALTPLNGYTESILDWLADVEVNTLRGEFNEHEIMELFLEEE